MNDNEIKSAIEAILFASGSPVLIERIEKALEVETQILQKNISSLIEEYKKDDKGISIIRLDDSLQMCSKKEYATYIRTVMDMKKNTPLSPAAMEVLAVIAYNQPVTKAFIEQVRGVDCSGVVGSLVTKGLIEEKGRLELPGRPLLYGTTDNFLRSFQIESLEDLPSIPEPEKKTDEDKPQNDIETETQN